MQPDVLRAFFRAGILVAGIGVLLVFSVPRDSAEFVVSVCSVMIGLVLIGMVLVMLRIADR